ncbi:hypothetical protein D3C81_404440 [compost metagenome]
MIASLISLTVFNNIVLFFLGTIITTTTFKFGKSPTSFFGLINPNFTPWNESKVQCNKLIPSSSINVDPNFSLYNNPSFIRAFSLLSFENNIDVFSINSSFVVISLSS